MYLPKFEYIKLLIHLTIKLNIILLYNKKHKVQKFI